MPRIEAGDSRREIDEFEARSDAMTMTLGGTLKDAHRDARLFMGKGPAAVMQEMARKRGERLADGISRQWAAEINAYERGVGTDNLPALLDNVRDKRVALGYSTAPVSFPLWCNIGRADNFLRSTVAGVSEFPTLTAVPEHGEIPIVPRGDRKEYVQVKSYKAISRITDQVIFGDDASALVTEPFRYGRAARMTVEREVAALLKLNSGTGPTLNQTGAALFSSTHSNYTSSGGAPTVTALDVARKSMRLQTDPVSGDILNAVPGVLVVPANLETVGRVLAQSQNTPLGDAEGDLLVAVCPYLDGGTNGTTAWYLMADPKAFDTVLVSFLDGVDAPTVESMRSWDVDGVESRVRLDFAVTAVDYRTMYRNKGA